MEVMTRVKEDDHKPRAYPLHEVCHSAMMRDLPFDDEPTALQTRQGSAGLDICRSPHEYARRAIHDARNALQIVVLNVHPVGPHLARPFFGRQLPASVFRGFTYCEYRELQEPRFKFSVITQFEAQLTEVADERIDRFIVPHPFGPHNIEPRV